MTCSHTPVQGGDNSGASVDLLSPAAMTNAYFICHNVQVNLLSGRDRVNCVLVTGSHVLQRILLGWRREEREREEKETTKIVIHIDIDTTGYS